MLTVARWWGPPVAYMGFIFYMSANPIPADLSTTPDYLMHCGGYFVLAVLAVRAFNKGLAHEPRSWAVLAAVALTIFYGISDEWHQSFVPARDASLSDVAADGLGAFLAAAAVVLFWKLRGVDESE